MIITKREKLWSDNAGFVDTSGPTDSVNIGTSAQELSGSERENPLLNPTALGQTVFGTLMTGGLMALAMPLPRRSATRFLSMARRPLFAITTAHQNISCVRLRSQRFNTSTRLRAFQGTVQLDPPKPSVIARTLGVVVIAVFFTSAGFVMAASPALKVANGFMHPPSDQETLSMFTPQDDFSREVEEHIKNHPVAVGLRSNPVYSESRPHLKIPEAYRAHSLTGGTLMGPGKVVVPPFTWSERGGKSLISISYLGADLCGHPGIVHGGLLATILDEGLARCCFGALPNKIGLTANLNVNYRSPAPAGAYIVLRAKTTKVEGRKAWVEGHIETLVAEGEKPVVLVEASALFIEPRQAATMSRVYPVS